MRDRELAQPCLPSACTLAVLTLYLIIIIDVRQVREIKKRAEFTQGWMVS
jgi:hypothetical protein